MNTTFKAILISIGSFLSAMFLIFAIGMCTPGFRSAMFRVWNVVPENQYNQEVNSNSELTEQVKQYNEDLTKLNKEKTDLLAQVSSLDASNEEQAQLIQEHLTKISEMNKQIKQLEAKISNISGQISNAVIDYQGVRISMNLPIFDDNGNFMYYTSYEMYDQLYFYDGSSLMNEIENRYNKIETNIATAIASSRISNMSLAEYDKYSINIDGYGTSLDVNNNVYNFSTDCVVDTSIMFDGDVSDFDTILTEINSRKSYAVSRGFDYEVDSYGRISHLTLHIEIDER